MSLRPDRWVSARGEAIFEVVTSGSRGWAKHYSETGPAFIRVGNLDHDTINLDLRDIQRVMPPVGAEGERTRLRPSDLLVSITAEVGMVALVPERLGEAYINQHIALARPRPGIDPRYIAWYLASEADGKKCLRDVSRGGTKAGLGLDDIRQIEIPLAPLAEQQRIADKLDNVLAHVDACRNRLARVAPLLKRFRQSVLAAATSGRLTEDWRTSSKASAWTCTDVQSVAEVGTGSTPLRSNADYFAASGTPWITSGATSQPSVTSAVEFVTAAAIKAHRLKVYPPGTLLVAMYGEGKTRGQVTELSIAATINQACAAVRVDEALARAAYVKLALQANYFEMRELAEGGNQPNLNLSKIKEFRLRLPSLDEQAEIVRRVEALFAYVDRLEARLAQAQTAVDRLTPSLLARAFRGELVPQDPADEPAAELLKRMQRQINESPPPAGRGRRRAPAGP